MTDAAERLAAAAAALDAETIRDVIAPLGESERRDLAVIARALLADAKAREIYSADLAPALYAAYGVLGIADLRSLAWRARHLPRDLAAVLRRRDRDRLDPIVTFLLESVGGGVAWMAVRTLVREGVVPRPDGQAYTIAMLAGTRYTDPAELIAVDPGLAEVEVWRLFEVEGGGEDSLANHEKFFGDRWGDWFRAGAAADPSTRARLLDASLAALARDFSAYRAGWFSRFHESLEPTEDERAARAEAYFILLRSRIGATVTFAVRALERVQRAGALDGERLCDLVGPVLAEAPASTATLAVAMVERSRVPEDRRATVLLDALGHGSADVQGAALAAIDRLVTGTDPALAAALTMRLGEVAASRRASATALAARLGDADVRTIDSLPATASVPTTAATSRVTDPLDPSRAIEPIVTVEELAERLAAVLEDPESADDVERVLDGVARLCAERPAGFDRLVGPIAKRARTLLARPNRPSRQPFSGFDPRSDLYAIALAWAAGEAPRPLDIDDGAVRTVGVGAFLAARAHALAGRAAGRRGGPLLAAPTHRGGWIEPAVLVERLRATGGAAEPLDLVAALLRLAPGGRASALAAAADLSGEAGSAVRYALGGDERIGPTAAPWVAAARARAPDGDDEAVERRHPGLGPDAGLAAHISLGPNDTAWQPNGPSNFHVQPSPPRHVPLDLPTVQQVSVEPRWGLMYVDPGRDLTLARWIDTVRPGHREPRAAVAAYGAGGNVDWWTTRWSERVALEPYLDPWTPLGLMARLLVGTSLGQREAGERGLATDVVIAAIDDGRLDGPGLADGLTRAADRGVDRPRRWANSLREAASASPTHAAVVRDAISRTLPAIVDRRPADLIDLLRTLLELTADAGAPIDSVARTALTTLSDGGGRTGKLATALLALVPAD